MFRSKKQRAIFLAAFAAVALVTCLTLVSRLTQPESPTTRPATSPATTTATTTTGAPAETPRPAPVASPDTITTTSGQGTTVTYQVQEPAPTDWKRFRVTPAETVEGRKVLIFWNVPDGENIKVNGQDVPTTERGGATVSQTRGMITVAAPDSPNGGEFTYRLEADRRGGGEPIRYEAKLRLTPVKK